MDLSLHLYLKPDLMKMPFNIPLLM